MAQTKAVKKTENPNKLGFGTFVLWCSNGASTAVQAVVLGYVTIYCTNALGLSAAVVGTLLMVSKIFDGITDLLAGYVVDRTNTKMGRGRPYDLCIIGLWVTTWMIFAVPAQFTTALKCVWVFICYTLCQSVFKTFLSAAGTAYMVRAFNNEQKYVKLSSIGGLFSTVLVIVFNVVFPFFYAKIINDAAGWSSLILTLAIPMCIIGLLRFFFIPEKYDVEEQRAEKISLKDVLNVFKNNQYIYYVGVLFFVVGLTGNLSVAGYYFLYIVKNVEISGVISLFTVVAMLTLVVYPVLLKKITTKQLIQYGLLISIGSGVLNFFANDNLVMLAVASILLGIAQLPISYMSGLMIIDCADYNEWQGRARMEGTLSSITGFLNKIGSAFGAFLIGVLLSMSHFDGTLEVQPDSAISMIRFCYSLLPTIIYVLAAVVLHFYKLDKMKPQINAELAERRAQVAESNVEAEKQV